MPQKIAIAQALETLSEVIVSADLRGSGTFVKVRSPSSADDESFVFCQSSEDFDTALSKGVRTFCTSAKLETVIKPKASDSDVVYVRNVTMALTLIQNKFFPEKVELTTSPRHPTALIHPLAEVAADVEVGPYSVIGARSQVSSGCKIAAHVVIENDVLIGENSEIQSFSFVAQRTQIGKSVKIKPHCTIGSEGFGFTQDQKGQSYRIPQKGRVVLEDFVEIGAGCAIDRATLDETRIGFGTKLDNLIHIGHNCKIGKHCLLAGGFMSAGSSTLGDFVMSGGRTSVTDHVTIASRVQIAGLSAVSKDVTEPGAYGGYPLLPVKDFLKTTATFAMLPRMRKDIAKILKHLGMNDSEEGKS